LGRALQQGLAGQLFKPADLGADRRLTAEQGGSGAGKTPEFRDRDEAAQQIDVDVAQHGACPPPVSWNPNLPLENAGHPGQAAKPRRSGTHA
jgi:hypothetical protein